MVWITFFDSEKYTWSGCIYKPPPPPFGFRVESFVPIIIIVPIKTEK